MKILADYKVLDLGSFITAPHAAMLLAELGADVIKVERPKSGDPFRWYNEGLSSPIFQAHNRNKRSIELDFTQPAGRDVLDRLVREADVILINVRPGVADKLGIGSQRLMEINPRLIYCSVTGFGPDGPYAKRPSYDTVGQAMSGLMSRVHRSDDARIPGPSTSDTVTGMTICMGALAALLDRERTGKGRVVETNMLEATLGFAIDPVIHYLVTGEEQEYFRRGSTSQAYVLRCKDGKRICLHMSTPNKFWEGLATVTERKDLLERYPDRVSRMDNYHEIAVALSEIFLTREREEWMRLLEQHDVPFAPELTLEEVTKDPQVRHLGVLNDIEHATLGTVRGVNRPIHFDGDNGSSFRSTPRLGEHSDEILTELGFDAARIASLREQGIC